jgi:sulfate adenylyltransferase
MIKPYGLSKLSPLYVEDKDERQALIASAKSLAQLPFNSSAAANAVMLGSGYFTPLKGFMDAEEAMSVARDMRTKDGMFWPVPILNRLDEPPPKSAEQIALLDPNMPEAPPLAVQHVERVDRLEPEQVSEMAQCIFGTTDDKHPGVKTFIEQGNYVVSGPIRTLHHSYFTEEFPGTFRTAMQIREQMEALGWNTVVAFQTRNPMHRAHEELCKMVSDKVQADGVLIHMLLGKLKPGDIPAEVRDAAIREMVKLYFPANSVLVTGYGFDMLYAGPREALLHAIFRQNCGCTHLIVGRDHAGVGDYYSPFAAQEIFDEVPAGSLEISIAKADHTAYSKILKKVVMMRDVPDHKPEDFVLLSGTKVREMLGRGEPLPEEFARPEVAKILMNHYTNANS